MEARSNMKGQTLLYIPSDDLEDTQLATRDKVSSSSYLYALLLLPILQFRLLDERMQNV